MSYGNPGGYQGGGYPPPQGGGGGYPGGWPPPQGGYQPGGYGSGPQYPSMNYATWADRVLGGIIDFILFSIAMVILYFITTLILGVIGMAGSAASQGTSSDIGGALGLVGCCVVFMVLVVAPFAVGLFNKVYLVAKRGSSIGQGVMKLKVVGADGNLVPQSKLILRLLAAIGISIVPFGGLVDVLWPLWDEKRQTLHDKAVDTYVIKEF